MKENKKRGKTTTTKDKAGAGNKQEGKDDDEESKKSDKIVKEDTEIRYAMGDHYDKELSDLRKVDFEYEQLLAKCKVRALKENKMDVYDGLEQKKMNRAAMKIYLQGGKKDNDDDNVDLTEVNKVWEG